LKNKSTGERLVTLGLNLIMIAVVAFLGYLLWQRYSPAAAGAEPLANRPEQTLANTVNVEKPAARPQSQDQTIALAPYSDEQTADALIRKPEFETVIPPRDRTEVLTYTVQTGDTLFSIADEFGLKPTTLLWGNFEVLNDNPHFLKPDQVLNILPTDGVYYQWKSGDTVQGVAQEFKVDNQAILSYSGNPVDLTESISGTFGLHEGNWVIVPGGSRPIKDWGPPVITRTNAAAARYYGEGACGAITTGAVGSGTFVWPTTDHSISGYNYSDIHPAIDIAGQTGNPVYAADTGVVVFAGWSNYGYGLLIVIDHGNGFQTAYAHLSNIGVACGQSVFQGGYIGLLGNTGNSSGSHLHFEIIFNGAKPNPLNYVQ
jgi:LysM repeat protein